VALAGLNSTAGFRTNIGITSLGLSPAVCRIDLFTNDGSPIGMKVVEVPVRGFVQLERVLGGDFGHTGEAWAEIACSDPSSVFAHASVVDERTGDPTYIPAVVVGP
jgi:hypothetical protein